MPREWLTIAEAANELGLSVGTVYDLCNGGQLGHTRVGPKSGRIRITREDCEAYLRSCRVEPGETHPTKTITKPARVPAGRPDGLPYRHLRLKNQA
jgi:excisionase family DNA binding protein